MTVNYDLVRFRLRTLRRQKGLSQAELAELADLSTPYISHIETGIKKPSLESIIKIANVLGVSVDELCSNSKPSTSDDDIISLLQSCSQREKDIVLTTSKALLQCLHN